MYTHNINMIRSADIENLPVELFDQYQSFVSNIQRCVVQNRHNIYILHGPNSEHKHKEELPPFNGQITGNKYYVPEAQSIHIDFGTTCGSIILNGLQNNAVIVNNKVNHVMLRRCTNLGVRIQNGTISGIDILRCHHNNISLPCHNYTNIEYSENIHFQADVNNISQLNINGSLDVTSNGLVLPINPFVNIIITEKGVYPMKKVDPPTLFLHKY